MYDVLIGKQRGLIFPVMCNGHVRIDYSDNVPSTSDNLAYGIFSHTGDFTFESILTPYDINGYGQYTSGRGVSCRTNSNTTVDSISDTSILIVGMTIEGTGIPTGTTITNIDNSTTITISQAATDSSTTSRTFTFKRPTTTVTKKTMPSAVFASASSSGPQSNEYLPIANRLVHEMNIFSSTNFTIALVNATVHNENQPAEYKIKVTIKIGTTDYTVTTDSTVINATSEPAWFYSSETLEGFNSKGRMTHILGGTADGSSNSSTTIPVASTARFHVGQDIFRRGSGFTFGYVGTIASINSDVSIVLETAHAGDFGNTDKIYIEAFKDACYINNQFHIACVYNEASKEIRIFLNGILVKKQTISTSDAFSMAQEDYYIGASSNNGTGTESAIANKQFMGELHEMSMVNTIKKQFFTNNLLPNLDDTLFYFRFEEVDI